MNMSGSETCLGVTEVQVRKRRYNPTEYKKNMIKITKVKGEVHTSHKGKHMQEEMFGKLGEDNCIDGLIDIHDIKRRRARKESPQVNTAIFKWHLLVGSSQVNVCLKVFVSGFGATIKRARRITKFKQAGKLPQDKRGKFVSYSLPHTTKLKMREHIESFPLKESHYCGEKSADLREC
ncbi:hypothetical protein PR048_028463 [Dryococelus australis]|uniref:Uncharacterized protein n=1 Tax=Dryococelus australis TaxID=614101 RepID=A0ABQ9GD96_9NEOP|nr:hypothetical protein PR048_028463 [Dryococelus australis]